MGLGRRINDNWSVFGRVGYEDPTGDVASRLAPTDGLTSVGLGATYTQGPVSVTGGLEYVWLGNAVDASGVEFADNTAVGLGLSIGYNF